MEKHMPLCFCDDHLFLPNTMYSFLEQADTILCSECFHDAKFITGHSSIDFQRLDSRKDTLDFDGDSWTDQETLVLLEALEKYNDNWNEIAEHVGTKSKAQCMLHFLRLPMEDGLLENIEVPQTTMPSDSSKAHDPVLSGLNYNGDISGGTLHSGDQLPFANSANPVMSLVAFLASAIGPRVAAACACASLAVLTKGDSRPISDNVHSEVGPFGAHASLGHQKDEIVDDQSPYAKKDTSPLSPEAVKFAAMCGLSAAATKAKLFADQEEREVQRLAATIINHQLKRLELKLKQFAEVETLLLKECEQVERTRQRLSTERGRMAAARFGATSGTTLPVAAGPAAAAAAMNANPRPLAMPSSVGQTNIPPASFGNSIPPNAHPHMQFMQRQQMFGFGPRLPLSAIHPSPSQPSQNAMFNSGMPNASASNHPLLRSSSGNNSSIG
ncbi:SWI/SNF complex subunit SWI3C isoform X1 [Iris pallida]|uniref:SWI/SNF complex subunit SWI3C isoform X1 n=1 Tax=Iris pallida TaxID=29817 RepID=A0AAX6FY07_IRIPA|nr:SWI/SNF complex subunit SWI3C isoform X1 [Iris pallida]